MYTNSNTTGLFNNGIPSSYPTYQPPTYPNPMNYYPGQAGRSVLPGRTVSSVDDIAVGEVPQDGSIGLFPQKDGSCIWAKSWTGDGSIRTMKFVPAQDGDVNIVSESKTETENPGYDMLNVIQTIDDTNTMVRNLYKELGISSNQNGSDKDKKED